MKVLVCDSIDKQAVEDLSKNNEVLVKTGMNEDELIQTVGDFECMIVRSATKVTKKVIDNAKNLKLILRGGVGLDNIDLDVAKAANIKVDNTPLASTLAVAELALSMMFSLARLIPQANMSMKSGNWEKKKFKGTELNGKILGLIGVGRIGSEVARRAAALGMKVIAYDPYISQDVADGFNTNMLELDEVIKTSDYISLHLPLLPQTKNMISTEQFNMMKDEVRILNCARGGIIDEIALAEAIKNGKVAGAALDVYETEPPTDSPLQALPQVIQTPHIGASTAEAQQRIGMELIRKVNEFGS